MSIKIYPADYARYVLTLAVLSGGKRKVRNISFGIKAGNPDALAKIVTQNIENISYGKAISLRKSLGRTIMDSESGVNHEPDSPLRGLIIQKSPANNKAKNFLNVPWLKDATTMADLTAAFTGVNMAACIATPSVGGVVTPDIFVTTEFVAYKDINQMMCQEGNLEVSGNVEGDLGADGVL